MSHYYNILRKLLISTSLGEQRPLEDLKCDYLGVYFTAPWCSACTTFKPNIDRIHQLSRGIGLKFEVVTFSLDQSSSYLDYFTKQNPHWTFKAVQDQTFDTIIKSLNVIKIPKLVIFDRQGNLISEKGVENVYKYKNGIFQYWNQFLN